MKWVTNDENDLWALVYHNKNDLKIFVYKNPKHKWLGVTLNFAHAKAWRVLLWSIIFPFVFNCGITGWLAVSLHMETHDVAIALISWFLMVVPPVLFFLWLVPLIIYFYWMAARDAQNNSKTPNS